MQLSRIKPKVDHNKLRKTKKNNHVSTATALIDFLGRPAPPLAADLDSLLQPARSAADSRVVHLSITNSSYKTTHIQCINKYHLITVTIEVHFLYT